MNVRNNDKIALWRIKKKKIHSCIIRTEVWNLEIFHFFEMYVRKKNTEGSEAREKYEKRREKRDGITRCNSRNFRRWDEVPDTTTGRNGR